MTPKQAFDRYCWGYNVEKPKTKEGLTQLISKMYAVGWLTDKEVEALYANFDLWK